MSWRWIGFFLIVYFITHLIGLTVLPVFADEAIYIRWSQLIISDPGQYLFFPLNDGKTPLQMWLMIPFLKLFSDPLFAGRLLSMVVGGFQIVVIWQLIKSLNGGKIAQLTGVLMTMFLPFWFFHHRMALIDGLLTFFLSLTLFGLIKLSYQKNKDEDQKLKIKDQKVFLPNRYQISWSVFTGISFGLALLTKIPAIFFAPVFPLFIFFSLSKKEFTLKNLIARAVPIALAGLIGLLIFFSLKLHPAFGQLFGRGGDFTYSVDEILSGRWRTSIENIWRVTKWVAGNMSWSVLIASVWALFFSKTRRNAFFLLLSSIIFASPLIIFGETLHPRYFMPVVIGITVVASISVERMLISREKLMILLGLVIVVTTTLFSGRFIIHSWFTPDQIPFVADDREQYLEEWSSGHGILEVVKEIENASTKGRVLVLTEGYFGTLPDALLMYFFIKNVDNVEIHGIGAPVSKIPEEMSTRIPTADTVYLVVNSHRMLLNQADAESWELLSSYPRPNDAPNLQFYQLNKNLFESPTYE